MMMMTTPSVAVPDAAPFLVPATDNDLRCIHCERVWPADRQPYWHTFTMTATYPIVACDCESSHTENEWHGFEFFNLNGYLCVAGMVCPPCVTTPGFDAVVTSALTKALRARRNAN